jgi:electron transfer flavoprotein alpha subunit
VANVLVFMDRQAGHLSERSKRVLGEGRRIACQLGATLYGVGAETDEDNEAWIAEAGLGGADKVVLLSGMAGAGPTGSRDLALALSELCLTLKPNLVLMGESVNARAVGGALAARMGALFVADATTESHEDGTLTLRERGGTRIRQREIAASEVALPVVATLSAATLSRTQGDDDADLIFFKAAVMVGEVCEVIETNTRPAPLLDAEVVVTAGMGAAEHLPLVDDLAHSLGAARASTRTLWQEGLADEASVVDWSQNRISPRLCIICGASGSSSHLAAISGGTAIVALGRDPMSPAFRAADYALIGELASTLPAMTQEAARFKEMGR